MDAEVRIGVGERRRRLVERQLSRVGGVKDVVAALVALHATDPATVFLSVAARSREPRDTVAPVEEALYAADGGDRLVRMLAMRRTMFVVGGDSAPDVYAAAGRDIAARERKPLLVHLDDGGGWDAE